MSNQTQSQMMMAASSWNCSTYNRTVVSFFIFSCVIAFCIYVFYVNIANADSTPDARNQEVEKRDICDLYTDVFKSVEEAFHCENPRNSEALIPPEYFKMKEKVREIQNFTEGIKDLDEVKQDGIFEKDGLHVFKENGRISKVFSTDPTKEKVLFGNEVEGCFITIGGPYFMFIKNPSLVCYVNKISTNAWRATLIQNDLAVCTKDFVQKQRPTTTETQFKSIDEDQYHPAMVLKAMLLVAGGRMDASNNKCK